MKAKRSFTLVELMLAMAFLGTMLIGIATITVRVIGIYQRGLTMRGVSSVGREIVSDFNRIISSSNTSNISINPTEKKVTQAILNKKRSNYYLTKDEDGEQLGGVFCTGSYSYIWNTAKNIKKAREYTHDNNIMSRTDIPVGTIRSMVADKKIFAIIADNDKGVARGMIPRLARIPDPNRYACSHDSSYNTYGIPGMASKGVEGNGYYKIYGETGFNIGSQGLSNIHELINDNEVDLALYHFEVFPATQNTASGQIFYSGMFILATTRGGVNVKSNGDYCTGSTEDSEYSQYDMDYCAVNKFNFAVRATGESGIYRSEVKE